MNIVCTLHNLQWYEELSQRVSYDTNLCNFELSLKKFILPMKKRPYLGLRSRTVAFFKLAIFWRGEVIFLPYLFQFINNFVALYTLYSLVQVFFQSVEQRQMFKDI